MCIPELLPACKRFVRTVWVLLGDYGNLFALFLRSNATVRAEALMLRKQPAFYLEREVKPRRLDDGSRLALVLLSRLIPFWERCLVVVRPATLVGWHRGWARLLWRRKSKPQGRPRVPHDVRGLIRRMARENPIWGEGRIRDEILLKTGVILSARTVGKYIPKRKGTPRGDQRWMTFVRNHARSMLACDLFTVWTAGFSTLYVFVIMEIGSRRIVCANVTASPTSTWIQQQLRQAVPCEHGYRFLVHDRDSIFSSDVDDTVRGLGISPLKTPFRSPQDNAFCERVIGTIRRECVDFVIPLNERHLRAILTEWVRYYNRGRPHSSLGPGIPNPPGGLIQPRADPRHALPVGYSVVSSPILGGLHDDYRLEKVAA